MKQKKLSNITGNALLPGESKMKTKSVINALLIGFLIGIIVYSIWKNSLGFLTLVPLFLIYKLINNSKSQTKELEQTDEKKERNEV